MGNFSNGPNWAKTMLTSARRWEIQEVTGHESAQGLRGYVRDAGAGRGQGMGSTWYYKTTGLDKLAPKLKCSQQRSAA